MNVAILSSNPDTLDDLQSYLRGLELTVYGLRDIEAFARLGSSIDALVVFPDGFAWESVVATVAELAERQPDALPVLVTARPQRFANLASKSVLVIPRPVWGWKILNAVREHVDAAGHYGEG